MRLALPAAIGLGFAVFAIPALAAAKPPAEKGPPACAAIRFRAVTPGSGEAEQPAGMYKSRFGRLELTATVKGGAATDYHLSANGKPLGAAPQSLPPTAAACAAKKNMPAPEAAAGACTGERRHRPRAQPAAGAALRSAGQGLEILQRRRLLTVLAAVCPTIDAGPGMRSGSDPAIPARIDPRPAAKART